MPSRFPIADVPYVLIDLDDTLGEYDGYKGWRYIGPPQPFYAPTSIAGEFPTRSVEAGCH